ncbi:hypothetical protein ACJJTC_012725 [Scirpophaga incertulas]
MNWKKRKYTEQLLCNNLKISYCNININMILSQETLETYLKTILNVIHTYEWLLDLYVLDFFIGGHWNKLPQSWRTTFGDIDPQVLGTIIDGKSSNMVLPLSFLCLMKSVEHLSIPRKNNHSGNNSHKESTELCVHNQKLNNLFLKHVKLKKRHEIIMMTDVVNDITIQTSCKAVLDFGSGLGHLVRMLAYRYELSTAGIECQSQLTEQARNLDREFEYTVSKILPKENMKKLLSPVHINTKLSCHQQLCQIELPGTMEMYGVVGLHPCGDLGPLLLKHFVNSECVRFICLVGCCYMKLTNYGYPMSSFTKRLDSSLSYASREIACHAIEVYCERLRNGNYEDLKVHAYRAALESILVEIDPSLKHTQIRSIKHCNALSFERYCEIALERLSVPCPAADSHTWVRARLFVEQWRRVLVVYTLRLALAPLVESAILLDRMLYVLENGLSCEIRPVFDPKISPRNHIMIAKRA